MEYALVTGGSRGIGRAICLRLAEMGFPVLINYAHNEAATLETQKMVEEKGGKAELLPFDVSDVGATEKALEQWQDRHTEDFVSVLVNNAGIRQDTMMIFMQKLNMVVMSI